LAISISRSASRWLRAEFSSKYCHHDSPVPASPASI
jgi:hypothetical protein